VSYTGGGGSTTDYIKVPVKVSFSDAKFKVNGNRTGSGATLQVSGSDSNTGNVSFYMDTSSDETDISGSGTLWCYNDFKMTDGKLQTLDSRVETLKVGTDTVDGTAYVLGGNVNIDPGTAVFGTLAIVGTQGANVPILDVGTATLNFKVSMTLGSNQCDVLSVGWNGSQTATGKANFGYNSGTTTVHLSPQGSTTTGHNWLVIFFGSKTGDVTLDPTTGFVKNWEDHDLRISQV
jgi:hypothetical protein